MNTLYDEVFTDPEHGLATSPTIKGFAALATMGRDAWNAWREDCETRYSQGVDWPTANFGDHRFTEPMNFRGFKFGYGVNFEKSVFEKAVNFEGANFGDDANFTAALFEDDAGFSDTVFDGAVHFDGALFALGVSFSMTRFNAKASFLGTLFGDNSDFDGANFASDVDFSGTGLAVHRLRYGDSYEKLKSWTATNEMAPNTFEAISFAGCFFNREADFSNRIFRGSASWDALPKGPVIFRRVPLFHNCVLHQDTSFEGAVFPIASGDDAAARAYCTLKLAFSNQQSIRQEQTFFKYEMAEEAASDEGVRRWLYRFYEWFADYGFSVSRPLVHLLLVPTAVLSLGYIFLMVPNTPALWTSGLIDHPSILIALLQFNLLNIAPVPGFDETLKDIRVTLFGTDSYAIAIATLLEVIHRSLALVGLFLFGLALRNIFKMK